MLCVWVNHSWCDGGRTAFTFTVKQSKKSGLFDPAFEDSTILANMTTVYL